MSASKSNDDPTFGFLRVADLGGGTLIGGYLILNVLGRPLEFHCTEPVKPNRAQQILYGATLEAYLYGEQIAQALVGHSELKPHLLVTDQSSVLSVRPFVDIPVVWLDDTIEPPAECDPLQLGANRVFVNRRYHGDNERIVSFYEQASPAWSLTEPFQRIHEAIAELQKAA